MHYAYIRVSSVDQHVERQKEALFASGIEIDKMYVEQASAKNINRPQLQDMLQQVRTGDTIVVHSIDRLCRNMMDMCSLTLRLRQQGITLIFLKEQLSFNANECTPMQELQLHMMSAFSQFERALIRERQTEGIAVKKQRGERTGRPPADISKLPQIDALRAKGIKLKLACDNVGLGVSTYYKLRHQLKNGGIQ